MNGGRGGQRGEKKKISYRYAEAISKIGFWEREGPHD